MGVKNRERLQNAVIERISAMPPGEFVPFVIAFYRGYGENDDGITCEDVCGMRRPEDDGSCDDCVEKCNSYLDREADEC